jgi:hypothetical protein
VIPAEQVVLDRVVSRDIETVVEGGPFPSVVAPVDDGERITVDRY